MEVAERVGRKMNCKRCAGFTEFLCVCKCIPRVFGVHEASCVHGLHDNMINKDN